MYECKICKFITINSFNFNKHLETKKHQARMNQKKSQIDHKKSQIDHKKVTNNSKTIENTHFCDYCLKKFSCNSNLLRHIKKYCKYKNKTYECTLCGMSFKNFKDKKLHENIYCDVLKKYG